MKQVLLLLFTALAAFAADATGAWTGTLTRDTGEAGGAHVVLKQDGAKLTGTAGPNADRQNPIANGKIEGDKISFDIPLSGGVMKFVLTQTGEELKGDVSMEQGDQKMTAKFAAKRTK